MSHPWLRMGPERFLETAARYHEELRAEFEEQ